MRRSGARHRKRHVEAGEPGELVCLDSFYVGKLKGVGKIWQLTTCDAASSYGVARIVPAANAAETARFLREVLVPLYQEAGSLQATGRLTRIHDRVTHRGYPQHGDVGELRTVESRVHSMERRMAARPVDRDRQSLDMPVAHPDGIELEGNGGWAEHEVGTPSLDWLADVDSE